MRLPHRLQRIESSVIYRYKTVQYVQLTVDTISSINHLHPFCRALVMQEALISPGSSAVRVVDLSETPRPDPPSWRAWYRRLFVVNPDSDNALAQAEAGCTASMLFCTVRSPFLLDGRSTRANRSFLVQGVFSFVPNLLNLIFLASPYRQARIWARFS